MSKFPKVIYLQRFDEDGEVSAPEDVCWCEDQINEGDPCYVLESSIARKDAALKLAVEALERCQLDCNHLTHWDKELHKWTESCPAETAVAEALAACREAMEK